VKRFSCFSQSQPVSAHVRSFRPQQLAWRANSWWRLWLAKTAKEFHDCFSVCSGWRKTVTKLLETVL